MKNKKSMVGFPMDIGKLTIDGSINTGTLTSAISEAGLRKFRFLAPQTNLNEGSSPDFQILVANGLLETPSSAQQLNLRSKMGISYWKNVS